jgi:hypothetical protein
MQPVRSQESRDLDAVPTESALAKVFGSVPTASMQASAPRQLLDALVDVLLAEIERFGSSAPRERQALSDRVDRDDAFRAEEEGAADRELPDRPVAPDRDRIAFLNVAELL